MNAKCNPLPRCPIAFLRRYISKAARKLRPSIRCPSLLSPLWITNGRSSRLPTEEEMRILSEKNVSIRLLTLFLKEEKEEEGMDAR